MAVQETELERIERELDILHKRRTLILKWAGPKALYMIAVGAAIISILLAVLVARTLKDPLMGLFIVIMVVVMGGLCWLASGVLLQTTLPPATDRLRSVNIVRSRPRAGGLVPLFRVYAHPTSMIVEIDEMIDWREQKLAELKGAQS